MHRSVRRAITAAAAVTTAIVATLAGLAVPAQAAVGVDAAQNKIQILKSSGLYGDGVVILVDVTYKCAPGAMESWLYVRVSQVDGPFGTAYGEGSSSVSCTGATETLALPIIGYSSFSLGEAFASAELQVCDESYTCSSSDQARGINVIPGTREVPKYRSRDLSYQLPKTGEVKAGGAGAVVLVPYTCSAGLYGAFDAVLAQASPDGFANVSNDGTTLSCTEVSRSGVLAFHASGSGWLTGSAFLVVNGYTCDDGSGTCSTGTTYRSIKLV